MKKQTVAKLIAIGMIIVVGMSMGCVEDATTEEIKSIKDIQKSPDNLEKKVIIDSVPNENSPINIRIQDIACTRGHDKARSNYAGKEITIEGSLRLNSPKPHPEASGFFLRDSVWIYIIYDGELPIEKCPPVTRTNSFGAVSVITPRTPTEIKITGILEYGFTIQSGRHGFGHPYINATSWEYV